MSVFQLPPNLNLAAAPFLLSEFRKWVSAGGDLRIAAEAVVTVGTACAQVLLALDATLRTQGRRLFLIEPSPAFLDGMRGLGLEDATRRWTEA